MYITLNSDSFANYFPHNKPSHFSSLSKQFDYTSYEVALTDLHIINPDPNIISQVGTCIITSNIADDRQFGDTSAQLLRITNLQPELIFNPVNYVNAVQKKLNEITISITPLVTEDITIDELLLDATIICTLHFRK